MKITFTNNEGKKVVFDDSLTIEQLVKLGVRGIKMTPRKAPPEKDKRWFTHKQGPL
jgi:hypothetical protein